MVARRCFEDQKHGGGEGRELVGGKIVELDEPHAAVAEPHCEIQPIGNRGVEQGRDRAIEIRHADPGDMNRVEPIGTVGLRQRAAERLQVLVQRGGASRTAGAVGPGHMKRSAPTLAKMPSIERAAVSGVSVSVSPMSVRARISIRMLQLGRDSARATDFPTSGVDLTLRRREPRYRGKEQTDA